MDTPARIVFLSAADYRATAKRVAGLGLAGGSIPDAIPARAAEEAGDYRLLTFDPEGFRRLWPEGERVVFLFCLEGHGRPRGVRKRER